MQKFLVTGGAGFIGSNICRRLVAEGCFVRVVDNLLTGKRSNLAPILDKIEFVEADMGVPEVARAVVKGIDVILHEGALPSVPRSVDDPASTHQHCVDATFTLLLAARDAGVKRFVYAASSSAYGDTPTLPKVETMAPHPLVALRRRQARRRVLLLGVLQGLRPGDDRPALLQRLRPRPGPRQPVRGRHPRLRHRHPAGPASDHLRRRRAEPGLHLRGQRRAGQPAGGPGQETHGEVVNIACGEAVTVNAIIGMINQLLGKNVKPIYAPARAGDVKHSLADITAAKKLIGFEPVMLFREGLEKSIDWYRHNLG